MSNLSKKVHRPLGELSLNVPQGAQSTQNSAKRKSVESLPVVTSRGKLVFRPITNAISSSDFQEKSVQPKGKLIFRPMGSTSGTSSKNLQAKSRSLLPPKGIFRPMDGTSANKVTEKTTERKQAQQKSTADIENLFKVGNLKKATVAELQKWLRENGFEVKGRAKKEELLDRVSAELRSQQKENAGTSSSANRNILTSHLQKIRKQPELILPRT